MVRITVTVLKILMGSPSYKGQNLEGLASLKHAGSIKLGTLYKMSDNETLEDIALPALEEITGDLILRNALVKNINLPLLASVGETFNITTDNLTSVMSICSPS